MIHHDTLSALIKDAGDMGPVPEGLSAYRVLPRSPVGPVKVRAYASEAEAWRQQAILKKIAGSVAFPELLGRQGPFLVFRYLETEHTHEKDSEAMAFEIGRTLGTLNSTPVERTGQARMDTEFAAWLGRLSALRFLPQRTARQARNLYRASQPERLPICLDYWDAMPHNFGWVGGTLYLLDEKHLRPSFPGVGLVKPLLLFLPAQRASLFEGYSSTSSPEAYIRNQAFLEFYYVVAALYFYSLVGEAGRVSLADNPRFLDYRDRVIRIASGDRTRDVLLGDLELFRTFPTKIPALVRRRLRLARSGDKPRTPPNWQKAYK